MDVESVGRPPLAVIETPSWGYGDSARASGLLPARRRARLRAGRRRRRCPPDRRPSRSRALPWDPVADLSELAAASMPPIRVGAQPEPLPDPATSSARHEPRRRDRRRPRPLPSARDRPALVRARGQSLCSRRQQLPGARLLSSGASACSSLGSSTRRCRGQIPRRVNLRAVLLATSRAGLRTARLSAARRTRRAARDMAPRQGDVEHTSRSASMPSALPSTTQVRDRIHRRLRNPFELFRVFATRGRRRPRARA